LGDESKVGIADYFNVLLVGEVIFIYLFISFFAFVMIYSKVARQKMQREINALSAGWLPFFYLTKLTELF